MPPADAPVHERERARDALVCAFRADTIGARIAHLELASLHLDRCSEGVLFFRDCPSCELRRICGVGFGLGRDRSRSVSLPMPGAAPAH